jgi:dTDP-4-amino-4,6-dideoxygalactose transaminase
MPNIPHFGLAKQYSNLKDEILEITDTVMKSGNWMNGRYTSSFESWLAMKTKTNFAITVHSGTQALEIIAKWSRIDHDDMMNDESPNQRYEPVVRIPNITYVATLNAFLNAGYEVELIDTDKNGLMKFSENRMLEDFTKNTCSVGLYGANPHRHESSGIANDMVDGAQHWLVADDIGEGMAISFDPTKNLPSTGNGGAIVTNNRSLYDFAYSYRSNGKYDHATYGTNSRMSELDCAHLLVRTKYLDKWQWRRKEIRHYYLDEFKNMEFRCLSRDFMVHADQKFVIYTDQRDELLTYLTSRGIDVKVHYNKALSELPLAKGIKVKPDMLSTSVMLTKGLLSLPIYPELSDGEVEYIASEVKKFFTCSIRH